jgi:hypothetical protein
MGLIDKLWLDVVLVGVGAVLIEAAVTGMIYTNPRGGRRLRKPLLYVSSKPARVMIFLAGCGSLIWALLRVASHW